MTKECSKDSIESFANFIIETIDDVMVTPGYKDSIDSIVYFFAGLALSFLFSFPAIAIGSYVCHILNIHLGYSLLIALSINALAIIFIFILFLENDKIIETIIDSIIGTMGTIIGFILFALACINYKFLLDGILMNC